MMGYPGVSWKVCAGYLANFDSTPGENSHISLLAFALYIKMMA